MRLNLLWADDEPRLISDYGDAIRRVWSDASVRIVESEQAFYEWLNEQDPDQPMVDAIIIDMMLPWTTVGPKMKPPPIEVREGGFMDAGLRCVNAIRTRLNVSVPVILYSARKDVGRPDDPWVTVLSKGEEDAQSFIRFLKRACLRHVGHDATREILAMAHAASSQSLAPGPGVDAMSLPPPARAFVVHGRDPKNYREVVARLIERSTPIEAIILAEKTNAGRTLIEKLKAYAASDVVAVVIMTGDDVGRLADEANGELQRRARQNVILEFGYFIAKLPPNRTVVLRESGLEMPSDFDGVAYCTR